MLTRLQNPLLKSAMRHQTTLKIGRAMMDGIENAEPRSVAAGADVVGSPVLAAASL